MSKTSTRRLFAVVVALLVGCSVAGGPALAVATATGTVGEDVDGTLGSEDGPSDGGDSSGEGGSDDTNGDGSGDDGSNDDDSSDDSTDVSSPDGSNDDDSSDDSTDVSSPDGSNDDDSSDDSTDVSSPDGSNDDSGDSDEESTDDSGTNDSTDGESSDDDDEESTEDSSANDSSTDERSDRGDSHVPAAARAAGHNPNAAQITVDGVSTTAGNTVNGVTVTGYTLVEAAGETFVLNLSLDLPDDGLRGTDRSATVAIDERLGPGPTGAESGDGASADVVVPTMGALGDGAGLAGGDGARPIPGGLTGGATLGLSALAAVAFVRSPVVGGGTGSGLLGTLLDEVRPFVLPLRYSRHDDSDPLEHEARELVYEIVNETPGSYLSEVSERAGLPLSTTRHHMKVLEREELVSGAKLRGKRRFYPAYAEGIELAAALNDESTASIIDALARLGAASVSDLADDLGRDPSTISHHLQRLEGDDIITRERQGRAVVNRLSSDARTALRPETTPRPGEAAEALAD
jgi:DNA-binding transcriptional ArsR family regulator